jgi:hypothetical protein
VRIVATFFAAGWTHVARLGLAAIGVAYLFMAALGSGISEIATLIGVPLSAAQTVALAGLVAAGLLVVEIAALERMLREHASSPRLTWTSPQVDLRANGQMHLQVDCENTGLRESVAILRAGSAWFGTNEVDMNVNVGQPINSSKINQMLHRWTVHVDSPANVQYSTGTWTVRWLLVYFDNARRDTHGYVTDETITVEFDGLPSIGVIKKPYWLDATSTNEARHKRWRRLVNQVAR